MAAGWPIVAQPKPEGATITLAAAEKMAERGSFELRALRIEGAVAKETSHERLRAFFPDVSVAYRQNRTVAQREFDNGDYSVQLNVSQPVYDGGRTSLAYEASRIAQGLARQKLYDAREALRLKVRETYLAILQLQARASVAAQAVESARFLFRMGRLEHKQGTLTLLDLRERANEYEQRTLALRREEESVANKLTEFALLLQLPEEERLIPETLDLFKLRMADRLPATDVLLQLAQKNHPRLRQFRMDLAQKRKQHLITEYDYLPSVALTGRYGRTGDTWPPRTIEWGVGFSLSFNLWGSTLSNDAVSNRTEGDVSRGLSAGGRLNLYDNPGYRSAKLSAAADLLRARQALRDLQRSLQHEVGRALRELRLRSNELRLADEEVALRELRHKVDRHRFRLGEMPYRDFLEEERRLIESRNALAEKRTEMILSINRTEVSLGLALDQLGLINWADVRGGRNAPDTIRRIWKPRTRLRPNTDLQPNTELQPNTDLQPDTKPQSKPKTPAGRGEVRI